jgi:hypothetical protein
MSSKKTFFPKKRVFIMVILLSSLILISHPSVVSSSPTITVITPVDGGTDIVVSPFVICSIWANDTDGNPLNVTWATNASGSWDNQYTKGSIPAYSIVSYQFSDFSNYSTTYYWAVYVDDGTDNVSVTFSFTTEIITTSINTISPYNQLTSQLTITATGQSYLDNVTLFYRFSSDNTSWVNDPYWWNGNWTYRKKLTINSSQVETSLNNFPTLIQFTDESLADNAQDDGNDLVFTDDTGIELDHEIELFNATTGELIAWVNVTRVSSSQDTQLYLYYGNSNAVNQENVPGVWDNNFKAVYHLSEKANPIEDSTRYNNDGNASGGVNQSASGIIDGSDWFDRVDDYTRIKNNTVVNAFGNNQNLNYTISVWWKTPSSLSGYYHLLSKLGRRSTNFGPSPFELWANTNRLVFSVKNGVANRQCQLNNIVYPNNWYFITAVREGNTLRLYVNGTERATYTAPTTIGSASNTEDITIGQRGDNQIWCHGTLDEIRVSNVARNASWIKTSYNNMRNTSTFIKVENDDGWIEWNNDSNPDEETPWIWNFSFQNGTGYYEFFTIGKKFGSPDESTQISADARCRYYIPPIENENPTNGSTAVAIALSQLQVTINSQDEGPINWTIQTFPNVGNSSGNDDSSGIKNCTISGLIYTATYYWTITMTSVNSGNTTTATFWFTTAAKESSHHWGNTPPIARADGPYLGFVDERIQFDGSKSSDKEGSIQNFEWDFGDGNKTTGKNTSHSFSKIGNYTIILTVVDGFGESDTSATYALVSLKTDKSFNESYEIIRGVLPNTTYENLNITFHKTSSDIFPVSIYIDWGDNVNETIFNLNQTWFNTSHFWSTAGVYLILIYQLYEQQNMSLLMNQQVLVDTIRIDGIGYLIDTNKDGIFDCFFSEETGKTGFIVYKENRYAIDIDGDIVYDYWYDSITGILSPWRNEISLDIFFVPLIFVIIALIIIVLFIKRKKT